MNNLLYFQWNFVIVYNYGLRVNMDYITLINITLRDLI